MDGNFSIQSGNLSGKLAPIGLTVFSGQPFIHPTRSVYSLNLGERPYIWLPYERRESTCQIQEYATSS
ncbi:hypothetical protein CLAFUW4_06636 [Fulvia fulva]|uniref:Uncharacterized protein n=1 Tax=Passalora fulva TaxID=5499 RepID=A0A9Q8P9Z2_PASFU|nr:uncharacterized protein CLAFUR5_06781 [Fulvia fulva]KAK4621869.1 hypothetical protein CLAFUR4_06644 [Fulvia fulva]KAK4622801.1 hypothetical protein CLAFUR0_06638 [Fulvia fulva]UJO18606.1 hypothetical protein CLAFUR5_06781 [Fulvia fulva]WPV16089.1 hypothetical protein CLAFUW4_06636 [Fulvia fulva]WPV31689.1 hypothetical protein CLAFUW7_06635 [Fulvia fulva]